MSPSRRKPGGQRRRHAPKLLPAHPSTLAQTPQSRGRSTRAPGTPAARRPPAPVGPRAGRAHTWSRGRVRNGERLPPSSACHHACPALPPPPLTSNFCRSFHTLMASSRHSTAGWGSGLIAAEKAGGVWLVCDEAAAASALGGGGGAARRHTDAAPALPELPASKCNDNSRHPGRRSTTTRTGEFDQSSEAGTAAPPLPLCSVAEDRSAMIGSAAVGATKDSAIHQRRRLGAGRRRQRSGRAAAAALQVPPSLPGALCAPPRSSRASPAPSQLSPGSHSPSSSPPRLPAAPSGRPKPCRRLRPRGCVLAGQGSGAPAAEEAPRLARRCATATARRRHRLPTAPAPLLPLCAPRRPTTSTTLQDGTPARAA